MARRKWNYDTIQKALDGENVSIQSGYTGRTGQRKIGEEWKDAHGVVWKKTGIDCVVRVNKQMDTIRELVKPRCSICNMDINLFGDRVDQKIFAKTGKCMDCLSVEEQILKASGKYEDYEFVKLTKNKLAQLREFKEKVTEAVEFLKTDDCKMNMVMASGEIVTWSGAQNAPLLEEAQKDLLLAEKEIKELEDVISKHDGK
jgi:hypothetical protein